MLNTSHSCNEGILHTTQLVVVAQTQVMMIMNNNPMYLFTDQLPL